jgi:hypothetical protein
MKLFKTFWLTVVTTGFMPGAHAATIENDLFVCTGELIKYQGTNDGKTYYEIKETWIKDENAHPMDCYIDEGKILRQIVAVCRVGDVRSGFDGRVGADRRT